MTIVLSLGSSHAAPQGADALDAAVAHALAFSALRLSESVSALAPTRYPNQTLPSGAWDSSGPSDWTSGFFPGSLWLLREASGNPRWSTAGESWLLGLDGQQYDGSSHDVGFKILTSFGNAYRATGNDAWRQIVLTGAATLATRYSPIVGATRSWNGPTSSDFVVIVDNLMNLELLFYGAQQGGDPAWRALALDHALTSRARHVRPDGSTYQVVDFDAATGALRARGTYQGFAAESTWSRGQAWALYGFTVAYRESGDARFLETARATGEYFVAHLPADSVPYWDFELPSLAGEPRDSSAAAIGAAGLLELARLEPDAARSERWLAAARALLVRLTSPEYLSEATGEASILRHGTRNRPAGHFDEGLAYGDYYLLQALLRYRRWFGATPTVTPLWFELAPDHPRELTLHGFDRQECELAFTIVAPPAHGTLGTLVHEACRPGTPGRDSARVLYRPEPGFAGSDSFSYRASDGTHASEPVLVTLAVRGTGIRALLLPVADAKVGSLEPDRNHGAELDLRVGPLWRSYLTFEIGPLAAPIVEARLRLFALDGSELAGRLFAVSSAWTESGLTWNSAPAIAGPPVARAEGVAAGTWVEFDVTGLVTGSGVLRFALTSSSTDAALYSAREGAHPPELVLHARASVRRR